MKRILILIAVAALGLMVTGNAMAWDVETILEETAGISGYYYGIGELITGGIYGANVEVEAHTNEGASENTFVGAGLSCHNFAYAIQVFGYGYVNGFDEATWYTHDVDAALILDLAPYDYGMVRLAIDWFDY